MNRIVIEVAKQTVVSIISSKIVKEISTKIMKTILETMMNAGTDYVNNKYGGDIQQKKQS